jgi:hypothetical protein
MPTLSLGSRKTEVNLPDVDLPDVDLSKLDLPKLDLSKIDMPDLDKSKADIAKAITGAAVAVGLAQPKRSRWPFVLGAGIAIAVGAWAVMNATAIRTRLAQWQSAIQERVSEMTAPPYADPVAFTAAEPKPIEDEPNVGDYGPPAEDYPKGFGAANEKEPATTR